VAPDHPIRARSRPEAACSLRSVDTRESIATRSALGATRLDVLWHDLECSAYEEDLPLWRALADATRGPVLDVGAGTGRVSLDLATRGVAMVALDAHASLLETLAHRAAGLPVETVVADARGFVLRRRFPLVLVPMQTLQLLGGPSGRAAFLARALDHLEPGGLLAAALADAMECFDEERDMPPPPDACEIAGVRYASHLLAVNDEDGRAAIRRRREVIGPADYYESYDVVVRLDRVTAHEVAAEAVELGFLTEPFRFIPETEEYLGSTVLVLRAPPFGTRVIGATAAPPRFEA
jgi:SAM-dependent methyltransferase